MKHLSLDVGKRVSGRDLSENRLVGSGDIGTMRGPEAVRRDTGKH